TLVLVMRYARTLPGPRFLASTAVVLSELIKLSVSLFVHLRNERRTKSRILVNKVRDDLFGSQSQWEKMLVPAVLYFIQNNLQYVAVTKLDAATFQVTYQMKILTTAVFSVWMLGKTLGRMKWVALCLLTGGIALVQLPSPSSSTDAVKSAEGVLKNGTASSSHSAAASIAASGGHADWDKLMGLLAVTVACILSGLAGVWFEKVLKGSKASLWLRNVQLSFFSVVPGLIFGVLIMDGETVRTQGFFHGYNFWAWAAIMCQAVGGLIVALVV
ncbi:hypothetical protein HK102_012858, partial [Quaeritorhiza haematococci]